MRKHLVIGLAYICLCYYFQDEKIIILEKDVNLANYVGAGYKRTDLSQNEIKIADSLASAYLLSHHEQYSWASKIADFYDYHRQYAGYKQGSPERIVFINAFKRNREGRSADFLRKNLNSFKGGGSNYFHIKINLETNSCFDLGVNAPK